MLTEDENIVVKLTVQYVIDDVKAFALNVESPEQSLYQSTESAVRHVVGSTEMDRVLTEAVQSWVRRSRRESKTI